MLNRCATSLLSLAVAILNLAAQAPPPSPPARTAQRPPDPRTAEMRKAVEEFRTITARLGAREPGGAASRNGARRLHGRLFEYFRNDSLDAVPHQVKQRGGAKSLLRRNQFGFSVGGPVLIPRLYDGRRNTFFSLSYEGTRERVARASLYTIPTALQRAGDFSDLVDKAGQPVEIFDPLNTSLNPVYDPARSVSLDNLQYRREPFADNRIPAARLDPVAFRALPFYPLPNASVGPFLRNNYFINPPEANTPDGILIKLDHQLLPRHKLTAEGAYSKGFHGSPPVFPTLANPGRADRHFDTRRLSLADTVSVSPQALFTTVVSAATDGTSTSPERGLVSAALGLAGVDSDIFPAFRLSEYLGMGSPRGSVLSNHRHLYALSNGLSVRRGRHTLSLSSTLQREQLNTFQPEVPSGSFYFGPELSGLPGIKNTGDEFATFLLGLARYAELSRFLGPSYFRRTSWQAGVHDSYELRPSLRVSLGLNLDWTTPRKEKHNRQSTVDRRAVNPANGRPGALVFAGGNGAGRAFQPVRRRLEPRLSLAWNPLGRPGTVVRLSYSRSFIGLPLPAGQFGTQGFNEAATWFSPNPQLEPAIRLRDGVPPASAPLPNFSAAAANDTWADLIDTTSRQPVVSHFAVSIERELPGDLIVAAGASAGSGRDLLVGESSAGLNAIHPDSLSFRDQLYDETFRRSLRPYPQYQGFELGGMYPLGRYRREGGYLRVEKRSSRGLALQASYEFSTQRDDYSGSGAQDFFNRENEWSLAAYHRPHRFWIHYAYDLPLGPGKWLGDSGGIAGFLVQGWSIRGATWWASGDPVALRPEFNNTGGVVRFLRVNTVPGVDPHVAAPGPDGWFNRTAFVEPPDFSLGNASRTHATLRNPGAQNHDISLIKRVALSSEKTLEFLVEAFNFLHHADWNHPDPIIGPPEAPNLNAGKIIGSHGGRVMQLGLRFSF